MQLHEIQPDNKNAKSKRRGRGGKHGTFSGRGVKGQKSRAGRKMQPSMREDIKRFHKLKGYRQILKPSFTAAVTLEQLEKTFENGALVNPASLFKNKVIRCFNGKIAVVKILAKGKITKKLTIEGCKVSVGAKSLLETAGGKVVIKLKK
ncbi:MAG: uL15 family ribosomal protein [Candidatus Gribaldobacteria bacterium]|nr:uL15 family ribosomal protein [Candidatus Gribaldobacteria bacterium]